MLQADRILTYPPPGCPTIRTSRRGTRFLSERIRGMRQHFRVAQKRKTMIMFGVTIGPSEWQPANFSRIPRRLGLVQKITYPLSNVLARILNAVANITAITAHYQALKTVLDERWYLKDWMVPRLDSSYNCGTRSTASTTQLGFQK
jgi:hypothetical protein